MYTRTLIGIVTIALVIGVSTLTRGHIWGDDFASYVMQTESLLDGTTDEFMERNAFTIFESSNQIGPVAYPWGYPLILVPAYAIKGNHPLTLKLPGLFFYAGFLFCLFLLLKIRLSSLDSLLITALFAFNPMLLQFLDLIASDIPFLFFSTLALLLMMQNERHGIWRYAALGVVIASAFFIRTTGILLLGSFLGIAILNVINKKMNQDASRTFVQGSLIVLGTFTILWIVYTLLFPGGGESYFAQYADFQLATALRYVSAYFQVFGLFFGEHVAWIILYYALVPFFLIGCWQQRKQDLLFILFFLVWMAVLVTWPSWQGPRFIFPVLPVVIYFTFVGMKFVLEKLPAPLRGWIFYGFWSFLGTAFLFTSSMNAYDNLRSGRAINGPYDEFSKEVYAFIQENTPHDSVLIFFKPRAIRLMTDRDSILSTDCEGVLKGDYLVLSRKVEKNQQIPPDDIASCNLPLNQVLKNKRFVVYEIQK